jgi:hypothetical protein
MSFEKSNLPPLDMKTASKAAFDFSSRLDRENTKKFAELFSKALNVPLSNKA